MKFTTSLTLILCLVTGHVFSQTRIDKDTIQIDEVAIHGTSLHTKESALKVDVPLKYIPVSTATINNKEMETLDVKSINDAFNYTTGIKARQNYGGFQTFRMRGFGKPVIMMDGQIDYRMVYSSSAPMSSLANVARVEYLKGPASALYGGSSVGGIINIVRKSPWDKEEGSLLYNIGSYNSHDVRLSYSKHINPNLAVRLDGELLRTDGWRDNGKKINNLYFALGWKPSTNDNIELRIGAFNDRYDTEAGTPAFKNNIFETATDKQVYSKGELPSNMTREQRYNDPADFLKSINKNVSVEWTHDFTQDQSLRLVASYNDDNIDYFSTEELTYVTSKDKAMDHYYMNGDTKTYIDVNTLQRSYPLRFQHVTRTFQASLEYLSKVNVLGMDHHITLGHNSYYTDRNSYTGYGKDDVYGPGEHALVSVENPTLYQGDIFHKLSRVNAYDDKIFGFYLQDLVELTNTTKLMLGGRYDFFFYDKKTADVDSDKNWSNISETKSMKDNSFSYKVGLVQEVMDDVTLFGSVSSFYRPYREVYNPNYIYQDKNGVAYDASSKDHVFDPEDGVQYELGAKVEKRFFSLQANVYSITKHNVKTYVGKNEENKNIYSQLGKVKSKGAELDFSWLFADNWKLRAGYGYNETLDSNDKEGSFSPKNTAYGSLDYKFTTGAMKGLSMWWGVVYTDKQFTNSSNSYEVPSYVVQNLGARYDKKHYWLQLNVKNLTDELYYDSAVYSNQYIASPGRNWSVTLGVKL